MDSYDFSCPVEGGYPTYDFGLDYADASHVSLGDRAPWGGWGHDGLLKSPHVKEELGAAALRPPREFDVFLNNVEIGVNYPRGDKSKCVDEIDLNLKTGRRQVLI